MDPTDTTKKPIKVIVKHGDDLRQDMLTLQMLSLMDKVSSVNILTHSNHIMLCKLVKGLFPIVPTCYFETE